MNNLDLLTQDLDTEKIQENFQKLRQFISQNPLVNGNFKFYRIVVKNPSVNYKFFHDLGFVPRDVIITYISSGSVIPDYGKFTKESIEFNVSDECEIRMLLGFIPIEGVGN